MNGSSQELVEVPTIVSYSWQHLDMEQIVDIPGGGLQVLALDRVRQRLLLFILQLDRMMTQMSLE